ncbi:hypothetical protein [Candidatus Nitrosotenuis uzonensis]|uniref:hypothetical protein n=1 Tax=Candidatus Nitrosotenuis uzonensis TaxID=1407055 RepID=UPI00064E58E5|nr:hypothetical protein [Candidatus Nitrosotenuis uzonensis]
MGLTKKRVTFTIDKELDKKIRQLQVDLITSTNRGWSYSAVLEMLIEEGLKGFNAKRMQKK